MDKKLSILTKSWTEPQKKLFSEVQKAGEAYISEVTKNEQDETNSSTRAINHVQILHEHRDGLLKSLMNYEKGIFPKKVSFQDQDQELNQLYSKLIKQESIGDYGVVTKDDIRSTQRKWLKYRDAFAKFGSLQYKTTTADDWKAWLTHERINRLKEFI